MEVLLIQDVPGVGKKNDLLVVGDGYAMNYLLPHRAALVATPVVRKRYAEFIKRRAEEREQEKAAKVAAVQAVEGKEVTFARKATKTGKLYGAISEHDIQAALKDQLGMGVSIDSIKIDDQIKSIGAHEVSLQMGEQLAQLVVKVEEEKKA